ncbi:hypothetical protein [Lactococcus protaetiae]|uniref:hypothetical protein n=1 Tax=Lactococcus protaetiae TaxID=2592653 RepID=UPI001681AF9A|nr:hypothetical protein [Lactococcus protaetiae]
MSKIVLKPNIQRNVESIEIVISRYGDKQEKFSSAFSDKKRNSVNYLDSKKALEKQVLL